MSGSMSRKEPVLSNAVQSFLNYLVVEKGGPTNTLEAYRNDLGQFVQFAVERLGYKNGMGKTGDEVWHRADLNLLTEFRHLRAFTKKHIRWTQLRHDLIYRMSFRTHLKESFPGLRPDKILSLQLDQFQGEVRLLEAAATPVTKSP